MAQLLTVVALSRAALAGQTIVSKVPVSFCLTIDWNGPDDKVAAMMQAYIAGAADVAGGDRASRGVARILLNGIAATPANAFRGSIGDSD
jgi:hypothetical protein